MGDHRQDSLDSRYHVDKHASGTVSTKQVVGRAIVVAWPVNRWTGWASRAPSPSRGSTRRGRASRWPRDWPARRPWCC